MTPEESHIRILLAAVAMHALVQKDRPPLLMDFPSKTEMVAFEAVQHADALLAQLARQKRP